MATGAAGHNIELAIAVAIGALRSFRLKIAVVFAAVTGHLAEILALIILAHLARSLGRRYHGC